MANQKISARTLLSGAGALSTPVVRSGSTTEYRVVNNLIATVDPAVTDDVDLGYHVGSLWRRSDTREEWYCADASDGAAVWVPRWGQFGSPRHRFYTFNDFSNIAQSVNIGDWNIGIGGTGAVVASIPVGSFNALGVLALGIGTAAGSSRSWAASATFDIIKLGAGRARFQTKAAIHILSDATDTYTTRLGFIDSVTGESTDGVFFRYTHGTNSGKWQAVCRSNSVETASALDTGVTPVADTMQRFSIDVNAAGTSAEFYIDGALVQTITANIPTGAGREVGYGDMARRDSGSNLRDAVYVDWAEVDYLFTTAR